MFGQLRIQTLTSFITETHFVPNLNHFRNILFQYTIPFPINSPEYKILRKIHQIITVKLRK